MVRFMIEQIWQAIRNEPSQPLTEEELEIIEKIYSEKFEGKIKTDKELEQMSLEEQIEYLKELVNTWEKLFKEVKKGELNERYI